MAGDMSRRASLLDVVRTVLAAFFGVRRRADHERDITHARPLQILFVALALVAMFILTLIAVVRTVVGA